MRLYRGLKNPYRPELVGHRRLLGTDFTDCPATALLYARGSRGVVIVADVNDQDLDGPKVTKELWLDRQSARFMIWGRFDDQILLVVPAKDLRTRLRLERLRSAPHSTKARVLRGVIDDELRSRIRGRASQTYLVAAAEAAS